MDRRTSNFHLALAGLTLVLAPSHASLDAAPPAVFPSSIKVDGKVLALNGQALCEWGLFGIDLYRAALYVETPTRDAKTIIASRDRKQLHMRFARSLSREQLDEAWTASLEVNAGKRLPAYEKGLRKLRTFLADVEEHDEMRFTFVPGRGLGVRLNDRERGWIADDDFALMFFQLYVGEHPPTKAVRRGLLDR